MTPAHTWAVRHAPTTGPQQHTQRLSLRRVEPTYPNLEPTPTRCAARQTCVWRTQEYAMKRLMTTLISLSLTFVASACNFASLSEPPKMSSAHDRIQRTGRIQGRMNHGAFQPIKNAPNRRHGG